MADLLIRAEMPRVCANCFACKYDRDSGLSACNISGCVLMFDVRLKRDKDCPIVEIPDHGRLIDADALIADLQYDSELAGRALARDDFANSMVRDRVQFEKDCKDNCVRFVEQSDTIIPASKEGGA